MRQEKKLRIDLVDSLGTHDGEKSCAYLLYCGSLLKVS